MFTISSSRHRIIHFLDSFTKTDHNRSALDLQNPINACEISFLPSIELNLITFCFLFIESFCFSIPKTSSTGASWGEYWGRNLILRPNFLTTCFVNSDKCIEALSRRVLVWEIFICIHNSINFWTKSINFQNCPESVILLLIYQIQSPFENKANKITALPVAHVFTIGLLLPLESMNTLSLQISWNLTHPR